MVSSTRSQWQVLARTENNGAAAVLFWDESSNRVRVALNDEQLCRYVDLEVRLAARLARVSALDSRIDEREAA